MFYATTTACWRGYVATWEIRDDLLHLVSLEGTVEAEQRVVPITLEEAFPWAGETIPATWFSGEVRCPEGRLREYVHQGFASLYERERVLYFQKGRLLSEHLVLNPPLPILYRIAADGERTCVSDFGYFADEREDPLAGRDLSEAHLVWGMAPEDDENHEEGYQIGGYLTLEPEDRRPAGSAR